MKRPAVWLVFGIASIAAAAIGYHYFPQAFSIVALDITMDRDQAMAQARGVMARDRLGPAGYRQAASFSVDDQTQTFVELEGGGKAAFTQMMRDGLYAAYTWKVRQFAAGETNETTIQFTPDGHPYGFAERLKEDAPGAALDAATARRIGEAAARANWRVDFGQLALAEQGQERRPGGRVDHTFTYERPSPTLNEGRYRLELVVSGDRLTRVRPFVQIPEAFSRRYENMRSANEAIGVGSAVGMVLLYVFGGIGVGLFFMLRQRRVLWRQPMLWGTAVALLQALASVNEWPLLWMTYDTAVPRATFLAQQTATIVVTFLGFSAFFGLSFMAAETLTRSAFGRQPQFWRVWSTGPGSSSAILRRTVAGFLLVSFFFAYDVVLYVVTTRMFGWWSPAEALLHPDVLATYVPWLSAIANSFQAGFWEECLFRAVPLAGAALIGERVGQRKLFLVIAFVVQALVFGAGHAPYPNQPSFARPVELIIPSIGFGLLYVYLGLLPGIILHFTFDVVWFALPIFIADAPGIRFQQFMVIALTLVPLWVVLWRRYQAGRWTALPDTERNAAWVPPAPMKERAVAPAVVSVAPGLGAQARTVWLTLGAAGLVAAIALAVVAPRTETFSVTREAAAAAARAALAARQVPLGAEWRVMPVAETGASAPHEFVAKTAGEARRRELLGRYLPVPRWRVRIAKFEGDLAERAEEWIVIVDRSGAARQIVHTLPEGRAGAALDETTARTVARQALSERLQLDAAAGQVREVSARPSKRAARTDWTFTFADATITPLPQGEARIDVGIAGDEVVSVRRYIYVPEEWTRQQRAAGLRDTILDILSGVILGGVALASSVLGALAWSRRRYAPALFLLGAGLMLAASGVSGANSWPAVMAGLSTAQPLPLQLGAVAGVGLVGLGLLAVLVGLALGAVPHRINAAARLPERDALVLGVSAGLAAAAVSALAVHLRTPAWAQVQDITPLGTVVPFVQVATAPVSGFVTRLALLLAIFTGIHTVTAGWSRRRVPATIALVVMGFLAAGAPSGAGVISWLAVAGLSGAGLALFYVTLLRTDLSMTPVALGTALGVGALAGGAARPFPGALPAALVAAAVVLALGWLWFRALRRYPAAAPRTLTPEPF